MSKHCFSKTLSPGNFTPKFASKIDVHYIAIPDVTEESFAGTEAETVESEEEPEEILVGIE